MAAITVWVHNDLRAADQLKAVARRVVSGLTGQARDRMVKRLRGPYGGSCRLRVGKTRIGFSVAHEAGAVHVWLHEICPRREVYQRDTLRCRAQAWKRASEHGGTGSLPYFVLDVTPVEDTTELNLLPVLSEKQSGFSKHLLPFGNAILGSGRCVVSAAGPPGSGKTLVAVEAGADAVEILGYDVLVLAPSMKLVRQYQRMFRRRGLQATDLSFASWDGHSEAQLWIEHAPRFFLSWGEGTSPADPQKIFDELARQPDVKRRLRGREWDERRRRRRFVELLIATWGTTEEPNRRDALASADAGLASTIRKLGASNGARRQVDQALERAGAQVAEARRPDVETGLAGAGPGRPLLILVDEVQDLAPPDWQALLKGALLRNGHGWETRIALLGDENQRLAATAFSWVSVGHYLRQKCGDATSEHIALPGSYRLAREVAEVAAAIVALGRDGQRKTRYAASADPDALPEGGLVAIVETPDPDGALVEVVNAWVAPNNEPPISVISLDPGSLSHACLDPMSVREAKGLEFDTIVTAGVFPHGSSDYGGVTEAYTAVTRARRKLICLLTPSQCSLLTRFWTGDVHSAEQLSSLLRTRASETDEGEQIDTLLGRIENLLSEAEEEAGPIPEAVPELLARALSLGGFSRILEHFHPWQLATDGWRESLELAVQTEVPGPQHVAAAVMIGDLGLVAVLSRSQDLPEVETVLGPNLDHCSLSQVASYHLRRSDPSRLDPRPFDALLAHSLVDTLVAPSDYADRRDARGGATGEHTFQRFETRVNDAISRVHHEAQRSWQVGESTVRQQTRAVMTSSLRGLRAETVEVHRTLQELRERLSSARASI